MMTVAELIEQLKMVPQDSMVVIPGYEGGYDNPDVSTGTLVENDNWDGQEKLYWYNGRHAKYYTDMVGDQPINCIVIGRGK
jgi:hypothetical protein